MKKFFLILLFISISKISFSQKPQIDSCLNNHTDSVQDVYKGEELIKEIHYFKTGIIKGEEIYKSKHAAIEWFCNDEKGNKIHETRLYARNGKGKWVTKYYKNNQLVKTEAGTCLIADF